MVELSSSEGVEWTVGIRRFAFAAIPARADGDSGILAGNGGADGDVADLFSF